MAAAHDNPRSGATGSITAAATAERRPASGGSRTLRWGLLAWWLLPLLYLGWLIHNALPLLPRLTQIQPDVLLAQLIALPLVPTDAGVALPSPAAALLPALVSACVAFLTLVLLALSLTSRPAASPTPTDAQTIAVPDPTPPVLPASPADTASVPAAVASISPAPPPVSVPVEPAAASATPTPATHEAPGTRLLFISHASGDNAFGVALADWLQAQLGPDWVVWYDSHGAPDATGDWPNGIPPTSDWLQEIQRRIAECAVFVVIETEAAMFSYWVQKEVELAQARRKRGRGAGGHASAARDLRHAAAALTRPVRGLPHRRG